MECSICLEPARASEKDFAVTTCGHIFHRECIVLWLGNAHNCPQCRIGIRKCGLRTVFLNSRNSIDHQSLELALKHHKLQNDYEQLHHAYKTLEGAHTNAIGALEQKVDTLKSNIQRYEERMKKQRRLQVAEPTVKFPIHTNPNGQRRRNAPGQYDHIQSKVAMAWKRPINNNNR